MRKCSGVRQDWVGFKPLVREGFGGKTECEVFGVGQGRDGLRRLVTAGSRWRVNLQETGKTESDSNGCCGSGLGNVWRVNSSGTAKRVRSQRGHCRKALGSRWSVNLQESDKAGSDSNGYCGAALRSRRSATSSGSGIAGSDSDNYRGRSVGSKWKQCKLMGSARLGRTQTVVAGGLVALMVCVLRETRRLRRASSQDQLPHSISQRF